MTTKKSPLNNSLLLRGNIWHIHWNVPKGLRNDPLFRGKAIYSKSLKTRDVHEARKMRDLLVGQFREMAAASSTHASRRAFLAAYNEARQARIALDSRSVYLDDRELTNAVDALESAFNVDAEIARGDYVKADAFLAAIHDQPEVADKYAITLKDAAWEFTKAHEGKADRVTLSRIKNATASLVQALGGKDIPLKELTNRQVTRWITSLSASLSDSTRRSYIVALEKMWHWVWLNEHVDGASPFKGTKIDRQGDGTSYEEFTVEEVKSLISHASPEELELMRYGLITGCRISELVELTEANFIICEGVHVVQIFEGKTKAAKRSIPLPEHLWTSLKGCVMSGAWNKRLAEHWSQKFGRLKLKATGKRDRVKGFHSFRHMTATAYEQVHTEERIVAVILGHKHKRGESLSYGLYSSGLAPHQYLEAVETMLASDYMTQFLKLFNK
ncbi:tyrosine-type recombinase/integrase [Aeromonas rivipollensis]|uniref:tyrosine-type recombinase/integrase n=1 Tax=Aeromonas rivipollensis TaxID=948519 RepID=UPI001F1DFD11|nr:tyrosine-type recombinase/integrase [Aeromonas rivipollensis]MCE9958228.1 tyrosine-type recombinase/integrase [Aeromonas rivipollensis]